METNRLPQIYMLWQEIDPKVDMSHSSKVAVKYFEEKYHQKVIAIACHEDVVKMLQDTHPDILVFVDRYVFTPTHLNLYGKTNAKHTEGETYENTGE